MAKQKRKRAADSDATQNKASMHIPYRGAHSFISDMLRQVPRRARALELGQVEQHMTVTNTSTHVRRAFTRSTKRKDTEAARNGVFNTEELLEAILLFLPPVNIIKCQRVAQNWRNTINGSAQIKQKLLVRCSDDFENWTVQGGKFVATSETADVLRDTFHGDRAWIDVMAVTSSLSPLVSSCIPMKPRMGLRHGQTYGTRARTIIQLSRDFEKGFIQLLRGQSSPMLEAMLVHNLPATQLDIDFRAETVGGWSIRHPYSSLRLSGPFTVGALAEMVRGLHSLGTSITSPGGKVDYTQGLGDVASIVRKVESWSKEKLEIISMDIIVYGMLFASIEDREAVRAGKGDKVPGT
ncbi:uncharacterized protein MYCFIDRAFT_80170 [Pseudocercospora fijiensis CIRAD86]|uniref:F-box domain-containing protein n=1 Tax=Pseudocercospora fijiensis (strain CIRAD86) TaxID=383855 RepID=N1Q7T1_PSEFD|nr:uncharacterized protein MYCFIDRAFT_80170 [Pseudocercospora fijiensis CIRAD86]EME88810.1 hypothetical protein MYCFIDRAFT_80170 [Pseudocercospora fijiensis CIRAD86]